MRAQPEAGEGDSAAREPDGTESIPPVPAFPTQFSVPDGDAQAAHGSVDPPSESVMTGGPSAADVSEGQYKELLVEQIRQSNISLAAALEKARRWEWSGEELTLTFSSSYEAALVKNEADTVRRVGMAVGLPSFTVHTRAEIPPPEQHDTGSRVNLVSQVFRGQIWKG